MIRRHAELGINEVMIATSTLFPEGPDPVVFARFKHGIIPAAAELTPAGRKAGNRAARSV